MERLKVFTLEEVMPKIVLTPGGRKLKERYDLEGQLVNMTSQRLQLFKTKGVKCCNCGVEGTFFASEIAGDNVNPHLNLYGVRDGEEVLITKDHILPKFKGGSNTLDNYQVMCRPCNAEKKADLEGSRMRNMFGEVMDLQLAKVIIRFKNEEDGLIYEGIGDRIKSAQCKQILKRKTLEEMICLTDNFQAFITPLEKKGKLFIVNRNVGYSISLKRVPEGTKMVELVL